MEPPIKVSPYNFRNLEVCKFASCLFLLDKRNSVLWDPLENNQITKRKSILELPKDPLQHVYMTIKGLTKTNFFKKEINFLRSHDKSWHSLVPPK